MYTMKDFLDGLCLIKVANDKEHYELMRECQKAGKKWVNGQPVSERDKQTCDGLFVFEDHGCGLGLCIGSNRKVPNVLYKDVIKNVNNYQIIIACDGDTTTARMIINGKEVKTAQAKRNPADKFNWKLAADLAFARLFGCGQKEAAVKEVKRNAKIGEYVKITNAEKSHGEKYKNGEILRVDSLFLPGAAKGWVYLKGADNVACSPREYVVLEGYKPRK